MTPRMKDALDAIRRLTVDGVSPSYKELKVDLGLSSLSGVWRLVHELRERGLVTFEGGTQRTIRIVEGPSRDTMEAWSIDELERVRGAAAAIIVSRRSSRGILTGRAA